MIDERANALLDMTVGIVANYVANNQIGSADLPPLIASVHEALSGAGTSAAEVETPVVRPSAAQVRKSISEAGIVSFIDGRTYQSLKRHLRGHGHDPETYRAFYGLPSDYPVVSPAYAAKRSAIARASGLGQGNRKPGRAAKPAARTRKAG